MKNIFLLFLIFGCTREKPEEETPTQTMQELYLDSVERTKTFMQDGWLLSKWDGGETEHEGEGLIWTWLFIHTLSCDDALPIAEKQFQIIDDNKGDLVRVLPLGEYKNGREITFDGAVGFYLGVASLVNRCGVDHINKANESLEQHLALATDGVLNRSSSVRLFSEFKTVPDAIRYELGFGSKPTVSRVKALGALATGWAQAVSAKKDPAFRIHLAWASLRTMELLGYNINGKLFCNAAAAAKIPLIEHWCGRAGLPEYIAAFKRNEWEYRHQRGAWETADGKVGLGTPGLDLLMALVEGYKVR